ncbi:DNA-directed DNA polymerase [Paenibacillus algicola]|uniref:DNA polymerase IV n=2 Tax=Paenibacillus algicola TaxID=2565926 RepID=A0A4P8XL48_9BACL|nr:DNA polymerase IV [Paenibacillus sp. F411]QCT03466.1 DNA-directed DNA polymerase [Paenibacillus algicola]
MVSNITDFYPVSGRVILHVDMNAFYCSVHEAEEPGKFRGKATAVAGSMELRKGIVVTCSYASRAKGIATGMTVRQALKLDPDLILIKPDFDLYRKYSKAFMSIAYEYTPLLEATSIDECYLDITGSKQFGTPLDIAREIQQRIQEELSLPCSIGVAPNKLLAKMGSDIKKPNGITVMRIRDVPKMLWGRPCADLFGIGVKTAEKLAKLNIRTIGQLAAAKEELLTGAFGVNGRWMKQAANGLDHSPVQGEREQSKSIGHTTTLPADITTPEQARKVFLNLADQVARRLRRQELMASGIQITLRTPDMKTLTRSKLFPGPTENTEDIYREACTLYDRHWQDGRPLRLLGITLQQLAPRIHSAIQLDLFDYEQQPRKESLTRVMDELRDKFGESAVLTAGMLGDDPSSLIRNHKLRGTSLQMDFADRKRDREKSARNETEMKEWHDPD